MERAYLKKLDMTFCSAIAEHYSDVSFNVNAQIDLAAPLFCDTVVYIFLPYVVQKAIDLLEREPCALKVSLFQGKKEEEKDESGNDDTHNRLNSLLEILNLSMQEIERMLIHSHEDVSMSNLINKERSHTTENDDENGSGDSKTDGNAFSSDDSTYQLFDPRFISGEIPFRIAEKEEVEVEKGSRNRRKSEEMTDLYSAKSKEESLLRNELCPLLELLQSKKDETKNTMKKEATKIETDGLEENSPDDEEFQLSKKFEDLEKCLNYLVKDADALNDFDFSKEENESEEEFLRKAEFELDELLKEAPEEKRTCRIDNKSELNKNSFRQSEKANDDYTIKDNDSEGGEKPFSLSDCLFWRDEEYEASRRMEMFEMKDKMKYRNSESVLAAHSLQRINKFAAFRNKTLGKLTSTSSKAINLDSTKGLLPLSSFTRQELGIFRFIFEHLRKILLTKELKLYIQREFASSYSCDSSSVCEAIETSIWKDAERSTSADQESKLLISLLQSIFERNYENTSFISKKLHFSSSSSSSLPFTSEATGLPSPQPLSATVKGISSFSDQHSKYPPSFFSSSSPSSSPSVPASDSTSSSTESPQRLAPSFNEHSFAYNDIFTSDFLNPTSLLANHTPVLPKFSVFLKTDPPFISSASFFSFFPSFPTATPIYMNISFVSQYLYHFIAEKERIRQLLKLSGSQTLSSVSYPTIANTLKSENGEITQITDQTESGIEIEKDEEEAVTLNLGVEWNAIIRQCVSFSSLSFNPVKDLRFFFEIITADERLCEIAIAEGFVNSLISYTRIPYLDVFYTGIYFIHRIMLYSHNHCVLSLVSSTLLLAHLHTLISAFKTTFSSIYFSLPPPPLSCTSELSRFFSEFFSSVSLSDFGNIDPLHPSSLLTYMIIPPPPDANDLRIEFLRDDENDLSLKFDSIDFVELTSKASEETSSYSIEFHHLPNEFIFMARQDKKLADWAFDVGCDFNCPWCEVGRQRLDAALAKLPSDIDYQVIWHPFLLYSIPERGSSNPYWYTSMADEVEEEGIDIKHYCPTFANTVDAHRVCDLALEKLGWRAHCDLHSALMKGYYSQRMDIMSHDNIISEGVKIGLKEEDIREMLNDRDHRKQYERQTIQMAQEKDIHGVPNFTINKKFVISGAASPEKLFKTFQKALST
ncbi:putative DSBA-like thioredoxin domain [Monocercomonoides exilis]|uniref:putative DSBA-like thioredoxin domain n=1 Tax=Monocercomonoides exilis TaxID=2049356 RepID=UPI0035594488|nr:putative DSBA-like thioredoxin domain [Monocercomonoides exilis]|eukprot:MONOS_2737.1-p1 / transcript=MONOS_2737.1 / gene=MONOS_2737 / organism=Monocercomonoides_exilis_PA203 / gene_product=unspecified product / transcript_product=unspecified product / location=Mono_scaffold00058:40955-45491(-) / protein_length=1156 / sequence_SO=supercontig / SO=protein_coding / is_pseudo=false